MRRLALLLISVVLLAVPATIRAADSRAADSAVPQADPPGTWRVMTFDDATTTSRCVGRTDTVSCLLDTSWACVQRRNSKLCSKVYDRKSDHNDPHDFAALPQRGRSEERRVGKECVRSCKTRGSAYN